MFIDHGQGLITMYLHMSRLDVHAGDTVEQGQVIGAYVGSSGRATGPHLCWRMKLRNTQAIQALPLKACGGACGAAGRVIGGEVKSNSSFRGDRRSAGNHEQTPALSAHGFRVQCFALPRNDEF